MKKFLLFFLFSTGSFAAPQYRSGTEILSEKSQAIELQTQTFSKKTSFGDTGAELVPVENESFSINDWNLKYSRNFYSDFEGSIFGRYRSVKSETGSISATNSGLESLGLEGKYLFLTQNSYKNALGLHFRKAMYTNTRYTFLQTPPADQVVLGDDSYAIGLNYLITYFTGNWKYDFKIGFNKPSKDLSSEVPYNFEIIYSMNRLFLFSGIGGIYSLKNDPYGASTSKPFISRGNTQLFNSINRTQKYLYAGVQFAFGNFIVGLKGESIFSARSSDTGNTISFNIRWESNQQAATTTVTPISSPSKVVELKPVTKQNYFSQGFVEKVSTSGNMLKINIGSIDNVTNGSLIDIFNIDDYAKGDPIAKGVVVRIDSKWAVVKVKRRSIRSRIQVGYLVRAY